MRIRIFASVICGLAIFALGGGAGAAESTADSGPIATAAGPGSVSSSDHISTLRASTDAAATTPSQVGELVVTGSRIPRPNLSSISPIQAVTHQEFQMQGATDPIDLLNTLPQNFQNNVSDFSNTTNPLTSPGGVTTADLRGLGPQRTLVLVNGRRLGLGDPNTGNLNPAPDLDQIPVAMIDHVEVLTGGASATYGSDAVAGVVNFVLRQNFQGIQIDGQYGADWHGQHNAFMNNVLTQSGITPPTGSVWDGQNTMLSVLFGANAPDDRGNVTGYFEFRNADPVTQGDRDYSDCLMIKTSTSTGVCANSENSNKFQEILDTTGAPVAAPALTVVGNQLLPFPQAGSVPPSTFNSSPFEFLSRQDTRYLAGFVAHYDVTPWAQPYAEVSFMEDRSFSQIGPSGAFIGVGPNNGGFDVNCNNPLLSAQEATALCGAAAGTASTVAVDIGRRNIEGGGRNVNYDHTNYRIVLGVRGDFADDAWHYDGYGSYYYTSLYVANGNYLSNSGIENALNAVTPAGGGAPVCANAAAAGCVPWNIWTQGGVTPQQLAFLTVPGTSHGVAEEQIFEGDLRGDLGKYGIKSPWANDGVQLAVGIDNRWDHLVYAPDQAELSNDLAGFSGAAVAVNNAISVTEEYFETRIPIAQRMPYAYDSYIEGGYRYSSYSTSGGVSTYKVGGAWAPTEDFKIRASYDRAIRAASIIEAFTPDSVTQVSLNGGDPCAPTLVSGVLVPAAATLQQCERTGVTAAQYGNGGTTDTIIQCPASQCSTLLGGNTALKPEIADSYSVGVSVTPRALRGFSGSIDYWNIAIAGEIGIVPQQSSLNNCLAGETIFCSNIVRTPLGFLFGQTISGGGFVVATNQNIAKAQTSGIDFQGDYRLAFEDMGWGPWGALLFHLNGSLVLTNKTQTLPGVAFYDCAGLFGSICQTVNPRWRHIFSVTWQTPWKVEGRIQWRFIGGTTLDTNSTQPALNSPPFDVADNLLPAVSYLDLAAEYRPFSMLTLRAGINNVLDTDPPLISQTITGIGTPNTYPTYDLLGRTIFFSATATF
jgi:iron complex outermembrane receptor protein